MRQRVRETGRKRHKEIESKRVGKIMGQRDRNTTR